MSKPYTYLVGWSQLKLYYYGVRYRNNCDPCDLLTTYFTSSRLVHHCIMLYGLPDVKQIRKTFNTPKQAILWERKVLRRLKVLYNDKWLNRNVAGAIQFDDRIRQLMSESKKNRVWMHKDGKKTLILKELIGVYEYNGYIRGHGQPCSGNKNNMYGKKHSEETKTKIGKSNSRSTLTNEGRLKKSSLLKTNNPMFDPVIRQKHKDSIKRSHNKIKKPVCWNSIIYPSLTDASRLTGIPISTIYWKIKNKKDGWDYQPS